MPLVVEILRLRDEERGEFVEVVDRVVGGVVSEVCLNCTGQSGDCPIMIAH